jgi:hypothetical protein
MVLSTRMRRGPRGRRSWTACPVSKVPSNQTDPPPFSRSALRRGFEQLRRRRRERGHHAGLLPGQVHGSAREAVLRRGPRQAPLRIREEGDGGNPAPSDSKMMGAPTRRSSPAEVPSPQRELTAGSLGSTPLPPRPPGRQDETSPKRSSVSTISGDLARFRTGRPSCGLDESTIRSASTS